MTDKQMPNNKKMEQAVLGSIFIDPESINRLNIDSKDFYYTHHQEIFSTMMKIRNEKKTIDYINITSRMPQETVYILDLMNSTPSSLRAEEYAAELRELRKRRDMIYAMHEYVNKAFDTEKDVNVLIADLMTKLTTMASSLTGAVHISQVVGELYDDIEKAYENPRDIFGFPVKIPLLNRILAGFQKQEVYKISGEPGVGKSLLAFQFLMDIAEGNNGVAGVPCALFQLEMNRKAQVRRGLSYYSKVRTRAMRSGRIKDTEWAELNHAVERMEKLPIYIDDNPGHTTTSVRAELARLKSHGVECALIDYEPLLQDEGEENARTAKISDRINAIAKDLDVCMITINDMTKAGMTGETKGNAKLAGSRRVVYNADVVMFLNRTETENKYWLDIGKYREGDTEIGGVFLTKPAGRPEFVEAALQN